MGDLHGGALAVGREPNLDSLRRGRVSIQVPRECHVLGRPPRCQRAPEARFPVHVRLVEPAALSTLYGYRLCSLTTQGVGLDRPPGPHLIREAAERRLGGPGDRDRLDDRLYPGPYLLSVHASSSSSSG